MTLNAENLEVSKVGEFFYESACGKVRSIRAVEVVDGSVLFLAHDIAKHALGVSNPFSLTRSVDDRSKVELVLTFTEGQNPQRYILVDLEGLRCMVYRARSSEVNRLDFINWIKQKSVN